ncbi:exported protein of unknown function [Streptomyces sp. KY75]|nr:exported protein of unknown function [Streptomyces sp. KY75]CAD5986620.1 exported protein of unknown function [Streptomyces sp. KY70]
MTSIVVRTISTVCRSVIARVSSRGAVPNTSVEMACGVSGCRNHSVNAAIPAWATRPIQDRFSGGIARYHGSDSSMRAIAFAASRPEDCSSRFRVAACRWASWAAECSGSGRGTRTRLPYRAGGSVGRGEGLAYWSVRECAARSVRELPARCVRGHRPDPYGSTRPGGRRSRKGGHRATVAG